MALLIVRPSLVGLALALAGCSLVLDPDDLTAELLVTRDGADATTEDTGDVGDATDSLATETSAPDTGSETTEPETVDAIETEVAAPDADTSDTPTKQLVVRWSGQDPFDCTLAFRKNLTNCPVSCPDGEGWELVIDASQSTGIGAFNWRFAATNGYTVLPTQAAGARVTLTVSEPDCALLAGADMGPGSIAVQLATDGGGFVPQPPIEWGIQFISGLSCDSPGDCPAP